MIKGRVTDPAGQPVAGAKVYITNAPEPMPDVAALTNAAGEFALEAPAPGQYRIACTADHHRPASEQVEVPAGGGATARIRLEK
jgi:protocatechuate 3,4-dioxygenase beta subunit